MNKILGILTVCMLLSSVSINAATYDALDVFEEYAVADIEVITKDMNIQTTKNTPVDSTLSYTTSDNGQIIVEIVTAPEHGTVTLTNDTGGFTYTPAADYTGTDYFQFRVSRGTISSNISRCNIAVTKKPSEPENPPTPDLGFVYIDMQTHWANYSAVKLVEADIMKGERIGSRYYFHPETKMRRIDVIEYILAALKVNFEDVNDNNTHIFADSASLPEYINQSAYLANKIGFVEGVRDGENVYLKPYDYINRAEIIRMIDIAMSSKTRSDIELNFADTSSIPDWAVQSVKNLVGYGIIRGFDDNTLKPYDQITKAQTAEMIYQMMKYNAESTTQTMAARIKHEFYGKLTA